MYSDTQPQCTIWLDERKSAVQVIDQRLLPHSCHIVNLSSLEAMCAAIQNMTVRGAGLIGVSAAFGMWLAAREACELQPAAFAHFMAQAAQKLMATRPTAVNLAWAVTRVARHMESGYSVADKVALALECAETIRREDIEACKQIGEYGLFLIEEMYLRHKERPLNILTHCNAGWLAFVEHGSALAPVYAAHVAGIPVHVWVDETRPRNQGAGLTAWELGAAGVQHTLIADNAGGHLMQHGMVDMVITGADRVSRRGDVANKIGTYLKALAAHANNVPFFVALPASTFDFSLHDGVRDIPIEQRGGEEVRFVHGLNAQKQLESVLICPENTPAANWAFDVTPNQYISALVCERGICQATEDGIRSLFPEKV